jgi:hypothetical protein
MSAADQSDLALPPHGRAPLQPENAGRMPCRWCGTPTMIPTLNHYGARCVECFERYCAEPMTRAPLPDTAAQRDMRKGLRAERPTGMGVCASWGQP